MSHHSMIKHEWKDILKEVKDITYKLESAKPEEVVFYRLHEGQDNEKLLINRRIASKAKYLFINRQCPGLKDAIVVTDEEFMEAQKFFLDHFYPYPEKQKVVAVTGTNGKTTTVGLCVQICHQIGVKGYSIGTLGVNDINGSLDTEHQTTTPSYILLRKILFNNRDSYEAVFIEVTSHALKQARVYDIKFDSAVWTNFTQDHLDYHKTMDDYFFSKLILVKNHLKEKASLFIPCDQKSLLERVKNESRLPNVFFAPNLDSNNFYSSNSFFSVDFNKRNFEVSNAVIKSLWPDKYHEIKLEKIKAPAGRFLTIINNQRKVIIDFAHTPDAIEKIVSEVRRSSGNSSIHIVFGCGGDRDKSKRSIMGACVAQYADHIYITSDNPRFENPSKIIEDIKSGIKDRDYYVNTDRKKAIEHALKKLRPDDILMILGKGHENYQEVMGFRKPYSDLEVVESWFKTQKQSEITNLHNYYVRGSLGPIPTMVNGISTDSRTFEPSDNKMFIALTGKTFDGALYAQDVIEKGCKFLVINDSVRNREMADKMFIEHSCSFLFVEDTLLYLQFLAKTHIETWKSKDSTRRVIGITGSNGKTTHKEMLLQLIDGAYPGRAYATRGNFNNHIGVPLTLLEVNDNHQYAIIEMGTNHPGEIKLLASVATPDCGIITNIGSAHIEFLGGLEGVFKEKRSLFDYVFKNFKPNNFFVINNSDEFLKKLPHHKGAYFVDEKSEGISFKAEGEKLQINFYEQSYNLELPQIFGEHNLKNMGVCLIFSMLLIKSHHQEIINSAISYIPPKNNRAMWVDLNESKIFMDAHNANPSSMKASLNSFFAWCRHRGHKIEDVLFIVGDMNELGDESDALHFEIGELLKNNQASNVVAIGRFASSYIKGLGKDLLTYKDKNEYMETWNEDKKKFKLIFIKASRSLQLESLISTN